MMRNTFLKFAKYQVAQVLALVSGHTPPYASIRFLKEAKTTHQLNKAMKKIQSSFWKLSSDGRCQASQRVMDILGQHVLTASDAALKLVAADWLRFFMQTGVVAQPEPVFVALVSAAIESSQRETQENTHECRTYLKLIFESFWPFRSPYAAYPRELFPSKAVFYPLIPLLYQAETEMQEPLFFIFAELPMLDDAAIEVHLLPPAFIKSSRAEPECQRRVPCTFTWSAQHISRHNLL